MAFDWDEQIRQQVNEFNRKLMIPTPGLGYADGGMPMMPPSVGMPQGGAIPGPVNMATGDDTMTPTKMGEYIIPVEAVMAIGKGMAPNSQLSPEDALAIGKQILDQQVMGLKKQMGDNEPVRNAGLSPQGEGYAEGGFIDPKEEFPLTTSFEQKPPLVSAPPVVSPIGLPSAPVDTTPVPKPVGISPTPLLRVSAGNTATGFEPAVEINSGNIDKYTAMKDARGVVANTPNNMPDLANTVKSMQDDGTGAKLSDAVVGANASPQIIMRGSLNDADAQILRNRVDWSPGSENVKNVGINAKYNQEVADAARINKINEEQRLNKSVADRVVDMNRNYNYDDLSPAAKMKMATDAAANDAAVFKGKQTAEATGLALAETKRKNDAEIEKDKSITAKNTGIPKQPKLTKNVSQIDGKWYFLNDKGESTGMEAPDPYRGKDRIPGKGNDGIPKLAPAQKRIDSLSKRMGTLWAKEGDSPEYQQVRKQLQTVIDTTGGQNVDLTGMGVGVVERQPGQQAPQAAAKQRKPLSSFGR